MSRRKVCVVVNSRANYGRIKSFLRAASNHPGLKFSSWSAPPRCSTASARPSTSSAVTASSRRQSCIPSSTARRRSPWPSRSASASSSLPRIPALKPDIVLTVADRFETIATAIAASYMNIRWRTPKAARSPARSTRRAPRHHQVRPLSFPSTERPANFCCAWASGTGHVHLTGCPSIDVLAEIDLALPPDIFQRYGRRRRARSRQALSRRAAASGHHRIWRRACADRRDAGSRRPRRQRACRWSGCGRTSMPVPTTSPRACASSASAAARSICISIRNFSPEDYARLLNNACLHHRQFVLRFARGRLPRRAQRQYRHPAAGSRARARNVIDVPHDADDIHRGDRAPDVNGRYQRSRLFGDGQPAGASPTFSPPRRSVLRRR